MIARLLSFLFVLPLAVGCDSGKKFESTPPFEEPEDVAVWATSGSAVAVYSHAYEPIGVADGALTFADPDCPTTSDDGTTLSIAGGCTDESDRKWEGFATVRRDGDDRELTFVDFDGKRGSVSVRLAGPTLREFDADLLIGGVTTIGYSGTVEGDYDGPTTWNGSGRVARRGFFPPLGAVDVTTEDEVVDDAVCSGQPASGATTLRARGDTAVVTYDGATACDGEKNAELSVNGEDRGLVSGINCAVARAGRKGSFGAFGWVFGALSLLAFRRRRP